MQRYDTKDILMSEQHLWGLVNTNAANSLKLFLFSAPLLILEQMKEIPCKTFCRLKDRKCISSTNQRND